MKFKLIGNIGSVLRTADFEEEGSVRKWAISTRSGKPPKREGRPNDLTGTARRAVELASGQSCRTRKRLPDLQQEL